MTPVELPDYAGCEQCGAALYWAALTLYDHKGSDPSAWPADLCVRELPA